LRQLNYFLIALFLSLCYLNCQKNTDSICGFCENDTSGNGGPVVRKPNIYIYPKETVDLYLELIFPKGGKIIDSYPEYNNGWQIQVEPSGMIDNQHRFLFYEAQVSQLPQKPEGWIIKGIVFKSIYRKKRRLIKLVPNHPFSGNANQHFFRALLTTT